MQIVADENIPLAEAFFGHLGEVIRLPGRSLSAEHLAQADVLLVRSVTQVNQALLSGTPVRFVGTCTIGTDHLDLTYLQQNGIHWASAPGCNARGVVDYVLGCLLAFSEWTGERLASRAYGVVGSGQVGGRLVQVLRALGWRVLVCDPPKQALGQGEFVSLEHLLAECDVISLHTPLTRQGSYPTHHLLNAERLQGLRQGCWLINASRGAVVDNPALHHLLTGERPDIQVALDVWEGEPSPNLSLAQICKLATPHIAGYSLEGKLRGTEQIYQALCAFLGLTPDILLHQLMPPPALQQLNFGAELDTEELLKVVCRAVYDPRRDDADFRRMLFSSSAPAEAFDGLRKGYPVRREIDGLHVSLMPSTPELQQVIGALGAQLCQTSTPLP